ncbi:MAG: hypothetical protein ACREO4_06145 [Lysobacter sp.]
MKIINSLGRFAAEAARAIRNHQYELGDDGRVHLQRSRMTIGGIFGNAFAPAGIHQFGPMVHDHNRVVTEGLIQILNSALGGQAQLTQFYLAPFAGNVTPAADWTGATFAASATEFSAYSAGTRLPWTTAAAAGTASLGNTAGLTDSTLTFSAGGPHTVYGLGLLSASAKGATTGKLIAATRFAAARTNMVEGDRLALEYVIGAKDEADA